MAALEMGDEESIWGFPKIRGTHFRGPNNKDYSILGVYIGVPLFWEATNIGPKSHGKSDGGANGIKPGSDCSPLSANN